VTELDVAGNVVKSYGYKPGSTWTTDPLFMKIGSDYYFYQNDHLGTPQKLTAINGAVVWSAKYSSFGEADFDAASTTTNNLRFPGQYYDQETGLHYNYYRYYDPKIGRYLAPDPIGLVGGINLFIYASNNSLFYIDPHGLKELCVPWFVLKTKWTEAWSNEEWKHVGTQVIHVGVSGACFWNKVKRGAKKRDITQRKLCWDSCDPLKVYTKKGKTFTKRERFEVVIDTDKTPIRWVRPVGGFAWLRECDRNYRSPFLPDKD